MNIKTVIFSGIMAALIGAMIGLAVSYTAESRGMKRNRVIVIGGATLGFIVGAAQQAVRDEQEQQEEDSGDSEKSEL